MYSRHKSTLDFFTNHVSWISNLILWWHVITDCVMVIMDIIPYVGRLCVWSCYVERYDMSFSLISMFCENSIFTTKRKKPPWNIISLFYLFTNFLCTMKMRKQEYIHDFKSLNFVLYYLPIIIFLAMACLRKW